MVAKRTTRRAFIASVLVLGLLATLTVAGNGSAAASAPASRAVTRTALLAKKWIHASTGGVVRARNGVTLAIPAHTLNRNGNAVIWKLSNGHYDVHINPSWHGHVKVTVPTTREGVVIHRVNHRWIAESSRPGQITVTVNHLSWFAVAKCFFSTNPAKIVGCLLDKGVSQVNKWLATKIINLVVGGCPSISLNPAVVLVETLWNCVGQAGEPGCGSACAPSPSPTPPPPAVIEFPVMNTSETPPDGVWFRNSPHTADTDGVTGHGVYAGDTVQLVCYAWGDAVGPYNNTLWYWSKNITRPTVPGSGAANVGDLSAHYVNDGMAANQVDAGVPPC